MHSILSLLGQIEAPPGWGDYIGETVVSAMLAVALWLGYTERIVSGTRYRRELADRDKRIEEALRRGDEWKNVAVELGLPIARKALAAVKE